MKALTTTAIAIALAAGLAVAGGSALAHGWGPGYGPGHGMGMMRHQAYAGRGLGPCAQQARFQGCPRLQGQAVPGGTWGPRNGTGPRAQMGLCPYAQPDVETPAPEGEGSG